MKKLIILLVFSTLPFFTFSQGKSEGQIVDIDGNIYNTVKIGDQVWLKENLKVTKYNNGEPIQLVTDTFAWTNLKTAAYCNYRNNESIAQEYGRLYNYWTVVDERKLCPVGTHVPNDLEWETLSNFLGGLKVAGGKMKESGTKHWWSPNVMTIDTMNGNFTEISPNESGFSALPAGRQYHNCYTMLGEYTEIWSTTQCEYDDNLVWCRYMTFSLPHLNRFTYKKRYGLSVRCIKD
ncbi:MAG: fibrobacter succinogenes major paralogous domain-containing protein [Bacteroidetes bacterium]|nr:fibrobacter succinogenes major paralogous domain-containing protein [Bacteroidota bacterium]